MGRQRSQEEDKDKEFIENQTVDSELASLDYSSLRSRWDS